MSKALPMARLQAEAAEEEYEKLFVGLGPALDAGLETFATYAAFNKARTVVIGGLNPDYPGDQWHFGLSRMTVACRAYGLPDAGIASYTQMVDRVATLRALHRRHSRSTLSRNQCATPCGITRRTTSTTTAARPARTSAASPGAAQGHIVFHADEAEKLAAKMQKGKFDLEDYAS